MKSENQRYGGQSTWPRSQTRSSMVNQYFRVAGYGCNDIFVKITYIRFKKWNLSMMSGNKELIVVEIADALPIFWIREITVDRFSPDTGTVTKYELGFLTGFTWLNIISKYYFRITCQTVVVISVFSFSYSNLFLKRIKRDRLLQFIQSAELSPLDSPVQFCFKRQILGLYTIVLQNIMMLNVLVRLHSVIGYNLGYNL